MYKFIFIHFWPLCWCHWSPFVNIFNLATSLCADIFYWRCIVHWPINCYTHIAMATIPFNFAHFLQALHVHFFAPNRWLTGVLNIIFICHIFVQGVWTFKNICLFEIILHCLAPLFKKWNTVLVTLAFLTFIILLYCYVFYLSHFLQTLSVHIVIPFFFIRMIYIQFNLIIINWVSAFRKILTFSLTTVSVQRFSYKNCINIPKAIILT